MPQAFSADHFGTRVSPPQAQPPWRYAVAGPKHDDFRADRRAVVEIDDVLVRQADPADETLVPMVQGSLVPWMRYSVSLLPLQRYMARAPSGLSGPPFMPMPLCNCTMCWRSSGLRASISAGGYQLGHSCLLWTVARPDQTKPSAPTPTP